MLKRRIKREMCRMKNMTDDVMLPTEQLELPSNKKYKYESRHLHAKERKRNEKGRFIGSNNQFNAAKPKPSDGEVVKKKRGRKSKKELEEIRLRELQESIAATHHDCK